MKLLLDTHEWLWFLAGDKRLTRKQRQAMGSKQEWIGKAREALSVLEVPITFAIATRSRLILLPHRDPADRFIAATAIEMKIPLVTSDERLLGCRELSCLR